MAKHKNLYVYLNNQTKLTVRIARGLKKEQQKQHMHKKQCCQI